MSSPSRVTSLGDPLLSGVLGGIAVAGIEIAAVAARPFLAATLIAVFAAVGGVFGGILGAIGSLAHRRAWRGWKVALLFALPALAVLIPVSASLFQGAYASTLPGASFAPYALPVAGLLGIAIAVRIAMAWYGDGAPVRRLLLAAVLLAAVVALAWANRSLYRSGYPDVHAGLTVASIAVAIVAARLLFHVGDLGGLGRSALGVAVAAALVPALAFGLATSDDRRTVTAGTDARHVVRLARAVLDLDRDGHASVLGGGDCDDVAAGRHPGARDIAGNGVDEDCDGFDTLPIDPAPVAVAEAPTGPAAELAARTQGMNVLLISVDALRADLLDRDSPGRADFPRLSALLDESVTFSRAFAPGAGTDLSVATLLTGRIDPFQRVSQTLLEGLRATGRMTHAILPREVLRYAGETLLTRGLDSLDRIVTDGEARDVGDAVSAGTTTDRALAFLDRAHRPFALWAHYFDVHEHRQLAIPPDLLAAVPDRGAGTVAHRYRALARHVDGEVGRLLDELTARGLADSTIIVFLSDHGESLGEDPRLPDNHGLVVYGALTRVPLAIRVPGVAPAVDREPVGLVDVAPTVLSLVGGAALGGDGVDLVGNLAAPVDQRRRDRVLVMNEQQQWAVVDWPWKLIARPADNLVELYDLAADPAERADQATAHPERVRALKARYAALPAVTVDRTLAGRQWRERQARPPRRR